MGAINYLLRTLWMGHKDGFSPDSVLRDCFWWGSEIVPDPTWPGMCKTVYLSCCAISKHIMTYEILQS